MDIITDSYSQLTSDVNTSHLEYNIVGDILFIGTISDCLCLKPSGEVYLITKLGKLRIGKIDTPHELKLIVLPVFNRYDLVADNLDWYIMGLSKKIGGYKIRILEITKKSIDFLVSVDDTMSIRFLIQQDGGPMKIQDMGFYGFGYSQNYVALAKSITNKIGTDLIYKHINPKFLK